MLKKQVTSGGNYFTPNVKVGNLEKITLFISTKSLICPGASSIKSFAVMFKSDPRTGRVDLGGITELVPDTPDADYVTYFLLDYNFECVQEYIVRIFQYDGRSPLEDVEKHTLIGGVTFRLSALMRANEQKLVEAMQSGCGIIELRGESLSSTRDNFVVTFSAKGLANKEGFFSKSDPFLLISRLNEDGKYSVVWRNQRIDNSLNPSWPECKISMALLCNGDIDRPLKIDIYDYEKSGKHVFMGQIETNVRSLLQANGAALPVIEPEVKAKKKNYVNSGTFIAGNAGIEHNPTFTEFIAGGCEISLIVAIDFTSSNGDPSLPSSLHYSDPRGQLNAYEDAIMAVGEILQPYDHDKMYPVYGFGGKVRLPDGSLSPAQHCFPVYGSGLEVHGVEGILQAYRDAKQHVTLSGPTLFAPLIRASTQIANNLNCSQDLQRYAILLILTDGVINDFELTKQAIIEASHVPLSIIIIGIGVADFADMTDLDSDDRLLSAGGKTAVRDIVQFVALRDFKGQGASAALAQQVLAEVPGQLLLYMQQRKITPNPPHHSAPTAPVSTSTASAAAPPNGCR